MVGLRPSLPRSKELPVTPKEFDDFFAGVSPIALADAPDKFQHLRRIHEMWPVLSQSEVDTPSVFNKGCAMFNIDAGEARAYLLSLQADAESNSEGDACWFRTTEQMMYEVYKRAIPRFPTCREASPEERSNFTYLQLMGEAGMPGRFTVNMGHEGDGLEGAWEGLSPNVDDYDDFYSVLDRFEFSDFEPNDDDLDSCDGDIDQLYHVLAGLLVTVMMYRVGARLCADPDLQAFVSPSTNVSASVEFADFPLPPDLYPAAGTGRIRRGPRWRPRLARRRSRPVGRPPRSAGARLSKRRASQNRRRRQDANDRRAVVALVGC